MMAFRPYTVENLQRQLKESHQRHRVEGRLYHDSKHFVIIDELGRLGRGDIVDLEKRRDDLARLGYDAEQVIADVMAGRDPLAAETERERVRDLVSNERLALLRLGIMRKYNDGSWCKPELSDTHPARAERRREIKFKVGALRARRAVESAINDQDILWRIEMAFMKTFPIDGACVREIDCHLHLECRDCHLHWGYEFVTIPHPPVKRVEVNIVPAWLRG